MDKESQQIILDCGIVERHLSNPDLMPPRNPTNVLEIFLTDFRQTIKHPTREALNIPQLPLKTECHDHTLPNINHKGDSKSKDKHEPARSAKDKSKACQNWKTRGRGRCLREKKRVDTEEYYHKYVVVSMGLGADTILFLYDRVNSYLIAVRDSKNRWWEFTGEGEKLFSGVKGLGFKESYEDMGTPANVGRYQFVTAFKVFRNPEESTVDERKKAAQIIIALTSESARFLTLYEQFNYTLTNIGGEFTVNLGGDVRLLMKNWSKASSHIIDNCGETAKEQEIEKIFSKDDKGLIEVLKERGMMKVEDASKIYSLLLGKVN